jgi:hypothetical protein
MVVWREPHLVELASVPVRSGLSNRVGGIVLGRSLILVRQGALSMHAM